MKTIFAYNWDNEGFHKQIAIYIYLYHADELCFGIANGRVLNFGALCT